MAKFHTSTEPLTQKVHKPKSDKMADFGFVFQKTFFLFLAHSLKVLNFEHLLTVQYN